MMKMKIFLYSKFIQILIQIILQITPAMNQTLQIRMTEELIHILSAFFRMKYVYIIIARSQRHARKGGFDGNPESPTHQEAFPIIISFRVFLSLLNL
jgi:hypothetical protein